MTKANTVENFIRSRRASIDASVASLISEAERALSRSGYSTAGAEALVRAALVGQLAEEQEAEEEEESNTVTLAFSGTWEVEATTQAELRQAISRLTNGARSLGITDITVEEQD